MENDRLKSRTVHFTDSDLHLIERLQDKLGIDLFHVVRLAVKNLAENENLVPKKR